MVIKLQDIKYKDKVESLPGIYWAWTQNILEKSNLKFYMDKEKPKTEDEDDDGDAD